MADHRDPIAQVLPDTGFVLDDRPLDVSSSGDGSWGIARSRTAELGFSSSESFVPGFATDMQLTGVTRVMSPTSGHDGPAFDNRAESREDVQMLDVRLQQEVAPNNAVQHEGESRATVTQSPTSLAIRPRAADGPLQDAHAQPSTEITRLLGQPMI